MGDGSIVSGLHAALRREYLVHRAMLVVGVAPCGCMYVLKDKYGGSPRPVNLHEAKLAIEPYCRAAFVPRLTLRALFALELERALGKGAVQ
jgi:hypothetical protein